MSVGYSGEFSRRQCKIQLSRDKLQEQKGPEECIFQAFKEPKIQNFGNHGDTSGIYWVYYYKLPV